MIRSCFTPCLPPVDLFFVPFVALVFKVWVNDFVSSALFLESCAQVWQHQFPVDSPWTIGCCVSNLPFTSSLRHNVCCVSSLNATLPHLWRLWDLFVCLSLSLCLSYLNPSPSSEKSCVFYHTVTSGLKSTHGLPELTELCDLLPASHTHTQA